MPFTVSGVSADIIHAALDYNVRGGPLMQVIQERPLLRVLEANKRTFPGGKEKVTYPVQGYTTFGQFGGGANNTYAGYTEADAVAFKQAATFVRAEAAWYEVHQGLVITETELKKDGISIIDPMKTKEHPNVDLTRITPLLQQRLDDFNETWAQNFNRMAWANRSVIYTDAKAPGGILSIIRDNPAANETILGINGSTSPWWRNRAVLGIEASIADQTLTRTLRKELRQLRRYGGRPTVALCGSMFLEALDAEVTAKGQYTVEGFAKGKTDTGVIAITMVGLGTFEYDPTLDDMNLSDRCYILDPKRLFLFVMEGEDKRLRAPVRPYDQFVFLQSMTWTGTLFCTQRNAHGVYSVTGVP